MKIINNKQRKGFTLVEALIYIAIFTMVITAISSFALQLNSKRLKSQVILEVNGQGAAIVRAITQSIRNGTSVNAPTIGANAGVLSISTPVPTTNPTTFSVTGETLYMIEGTNAPVALTNNKVRVTNLIFSNVSRPATPGIIQIRFTLSNTASATRAEEKYSVDFYGSAGVRQ